MIEQVEGPPREDHDPSCKSRNDLLGEIDGLEEQLEKGGTKEWTARSF